MTVYYLCDGGQRNAYHSLERFLEQYEAESDRIRIEYVDTQKHPAFAAAYSPVALNQHSLIVESDSRYRVIDHTTLYHYYNAELGIRLSANEYDYYLGAADYYAQSQTMGNYSETDVEYGSALYYYSDQTTAYFDGDALLSDAIRYVCDPDVPTVYVLCGADSTLDANLHVSLSQSGYFVRYLQDMMTLPDDCDLLFLYAPSKDLEAAESDTLRTYLSGGGKLFLSTSCAVARSELNNLYTLMREYGMDTLEQKNMLCRQSVSSADGEEVYSYSTVFYAAADKNAPATGSFDQSFVMLAPHAITLHETAGVTHISWLTTTDKGSLLYPHETERDEEGIDVIPEATKTLLAERLGTYVCGAIAQKEETAIVWISSALSVGISGNYYSSGGNYTLVQNAMDWLTQNGYTSTASKGRPLLQQSISLSSAQRASCSLLLALFLPLAVGAAGGIRIYLRKKR